MLRTNCMNLLPNKGFYFPKYLDDYLSQNGINAFFPLSLDYENYCF